jgi:PST family polysaccharide transporter
MIVWAIAAGTITLPIAVDVLSYVVAPYGPAFTLREWRDFAGFLGWSTASQAVSVLNWRMDQLILGRLISRQELGRFSVAWLRLWPAAFGAAMTLAVWRRRR